MANRQQRDLNTPAEPGERESEMNEEQVRGLGEDSDTVDDDEFDEADESDEDEEEEDGTI